MSKNNLLDFYREIVNSEKSFGIDYKNLSKQLIERIDKAIEWVKKNQYYFPRPTELLEILGDKENE